MKSARRVCGAVLLLTVGFAALVQGAEPRRVAFLTGVSKYRHKDMDDLDWPENDVVELEKQLKALGFEVTSAAGSKATKSELELKLGKFVELTKGLAKDDIAFLAFSGHGQQLNIDGELIPYFCPYDTIPYEDTIRRPEKLISLNWVIQELKESGSRHNLIAIDACRNNPAKGRGIDGGFANEIPRGLSILFSARSGQKSWESIDEGIRHGVFTHFLLKGMRGEARDRRGRLTWDSLVSYVRTEVPIEGPALAGGNDRRQHPQLVANKDAITVLEIAKRALPKTYTSTSTGMQFVLISPGTFQMGSPPSENGRGDDERLHSVTISQPFYMGVYEVTQSEFQRVVGTNPSSFATLANVDTSRFPVENVNWYDAVYFCNRLSQLDQRVPYYAIHDIERDHLGIKSAIVSTVGGNGYHLPTDAQWEYACRAGTGTTYATGKQLTLRDANFAVDPSLNRLVSGGYDIKRTVKVGTYAANPFGLHDMHGNVWEWVQEWYGDYPDGPTVNPEGPESGSLRVLRGGSWDFSARYARSARRNHNIPDYRNYNYGFRVVRTIP